ncbi:MAG TPA: LysR substrate-binding domain-containing protein [Methylotenera sp.]|jgi:LysR family hydrogen peroxide-inducible transcriptional activator|uniref:hydrogen peroxide-inducible genes activator n=1 Tax=Polaromonas sp. 17-63-33 TaxID=1970413 RepID=UPI000BCB68EE|nr:hydrogen peroxide-inducible genes activator [Polaromonas sp. 17-63-33]OYY06585.1 MAG: LysR family transcriptional regulator [Mehylophilales bacterium 35-46-6]OZA45441.1 MAG: LysR family transcriptional regulator [Polaromonas sp. 17-63-33]HQS37774.1 LysR substrate-binding domain-containing protein [Methylotenera sp.]HQS44679.1 LysR substrate-binding domain-containing protein [Methylotenera sp.]
MTLSELRFVVAVAKERNFRRASEKCFVSQPALSLAIKKLEEDLGVMIFERSRTDISPTLIGEKIIEQAIKALEEVNHIREIAKQGNNQLSGAFRLGLIYSVGPYLLPEIIPILRKTAPDMPLDIEENLTAQLETQLKNGVIDAAVVALPFDVPGINTMPIYDEKYVVMVPVDHAWAKRKSIKAEELADENVLLLNTGHCYSHQVLLACPDLSRKGQVLQGNSLETIRNMVASNLGVTVLPCSAATERYINPLVKVIPFDDPVPSRRVALAWRKSYARELAVTSVADAIRLIKSNCLQMIVKTQEKT